MHTNQINYSPSKYIFYHKSDKSLEVHWPGNIPNDKVDQCIDMVRSFLNILPSKNLLIDGLELNSSEFGLNWKIIESSWKAFYDNGGKKIVVLTNKKLPKYVVDAYLQAFKNFGIPLEIEIVGIHK